MRERLYLAKLAKSCESSLCMCVFCYHLCGEIKYIYYIDTAMHSEKSDLWFLKRSAGRGQARAGDLRWRTCIATWLNRNQVTETLRLVSCEKPVRERKFNTFLILSQCRDLKTGVMREYLGVGDSTSKRVRNVLESVYDETDRQTDRQTKFSSLDRICIPYAAR